VRATTSAAAALAVALLLPGLSGCGGGDEPAGEATPSEPATPEPAADEVAGSAAAPARTTPHHWPRPLTPEIYEEREVDDPAALRGTISAAVEGVARAFDHPPDPACEGPGLPHTYPAGPLAGAVVWLEGVDAGHALAFEPPIVDARGCTLSPRLQLAGLGSRLTATSGDEAPHTLQLIGWPGHRDLGTLETGSGEDAPARRLRTAGLVLLRDESHPASRAWILVSDHPYAAITGPDGAFRIGGIPPGNYALHVWHEAHEEYVGGVILHASGDELSDIVLGG